jgi:hypothetical protein
MDKALLIPLLAIPEERFSHRFDLEPEQRRLGEELPIVEGRYRLVAEPTDRLECVATDQTIGAAETIDESAGCDVATKERRECSSLSSEAEFAEPMKKVSVEVTISASVRSATCR